VKRTNYISWDDYFMGVAYLSAMRSKDESSQVGACIVNVQNRIVGIGYNGLPIGCSDEAFPWEREGQWLDTKYPYVVHAEPNAILNATVPLQGARIYVTLFPCNECAKLIIQSGIKEIIYLSDKYMGTEIDVASKRLLQAAKVTWRKLETFRIRVSIDE
jgi:dCMP deaminase